MEADTISAGIIQALITCNKQHFSQAHGTPFTINPLKKIFGYAAEKEFQQQIQQLQDKLKTLDHAKKRFINTMFN